MGGVFKSVGKVVGSLLGTKQEAPAVIAPAVMPTPDDDAVNQARRRKAAELQSRGGRASTILSQDEKLGG